jgi:DNA-binding transcriptional MerR regulator/methylmalonyl-CoA mutase cobalamin-binding subunit
MAEARYPIQMAARLAGLSPYVIRIWEQRYKAVRPERTATKRRLYSERDLERLKCLREATRAGHRIGQVAQLPTSQLRKLAAARPEPFAPTVGTPVADAASFIEACLASVRTLDAGGLDESLKRAGARLGVQGMLARVVAPLTQVLGELWREGEITAAHEHFATNQVRAFLTGLAKPYGGGEGGPALVVATPAGQLHEMGALLAGALAANLGWRVTHLGASLPALEIAGAAREKGARAVALSLVYPEDDTALPRELKRLREALTPGTALLAGGRAAPAYRDTLESLGAVIVTDLANLGDALDGLRRSRPLTIRDKS